MALSVLHAFASAKGDPADATLVRPSNWNAEHTILMATAKVLGRSTAGTGAVEELSATTSGLAILAAASAAAQLAIVAPAGSITKTMMADIATQTLLGRGTAGTGVPESITLGAGVTITGGALTVAPALPRGYIDGLILSNGTDTTNDINIAAGVCRDSTNTVNITIATAMGKQLDANWASGGTTGTPLGGRDSAAGIANTTYHLHAVVKSDATGNDIFFSTSVVPATALAALVVMDATYASGYARLIGSIVRSLPGPTILQFKQYADGLVIWNAPIQETGLTAFDTTQRNYTLTVPAGINGMPVDCSINGRTSAWQGALVSGHPDQTLALPSSTAVSSTPFDTVALSNVNHESSYARLWRTTNASAQIAVRAAAATTTSYIATFGFRHPRGKDA